MMAAATARICHWLHVARCKYRTQNRQKLAIWVPSHNLVGYVFATKARIDNWKKNCYAAISPPHVPTIWWTSAH